MPDGGAGAELDKDGELLLLGQRVGRLRVRESNWSWFASRSWVRVCGPRDWKRVRNWFVIAEAEEELEERRLERMMGRVRRVGRVGRERNCAKREGREGEDIVSFCCRCFIC